MEVQNFLRKVDIFSNLSPRYLKQIAQICKERPFKKGSWIVRQGEEGTGLFIILSGKVTIIKKTDEGEEMEIASHGPGEFFGEFSVLDGAVRTASVRADEDTICLVLVTWDFNSLMKTYPEIALEILPVVVTRFRETNERLLGKTKI